MRRDASEFMQGGGAAAAAAAAPRRVVRLHALPNSLAKFSASTCRSFLNSSICCSFSSYRHRGRLGGQGRRDESVGGRGCASWGSGVVGRART